MKGPLKVKGAKIYVHNILELRDGLSPEMQDEKKSFKHFSFELTESLFSGHRCLATPLSALFNAEESGLAVVVLVAHLALLLAPHRKASSGG